MTGPAQAARCDWRSLSVAVLLATALAPPALAQTAANEPLAVPIGWLKVVEPDPPILSNLAPPPADTGLAGARLGREDNATTGSFTGHDYQLTETLVPEGEDPLAAARSALAQTPFLLVDAPAETMVKIADLPEAQGALIFNVARAMPSSVATTIVPVAEKVIAARSGWLLWAGALVALWTVSSLVETIRDILRRAYETKSGSSFFKKRLISIGLILGAVVLLMLSLFAQVLIGGAQEVIQATVPQFATLIGALRLSRIVPGIGLAVSLWILFVTLTPKSYRGRQWPKWPGALFTTVWWVSMTAGLPFVLSRLGGYDLTYGSLAGVIVALFFFYIIGLGVVIGPLSSAALRAGSGQSVAWISAASTSAATPATTSAASPVRTTSAPPRAFRSVTMPSRCGKDRPSRSSFHTTSMSPAFRYSRQAFSPGRSSRAPDALSV